MKRVICVILLVVICAFAVSCGDSSKVEIPNGMKAAYEESDLFYFFIPSEWTYDRGHDMPYAYFSATDTSNVMIMLYMLDDAEITTVPDGTTAASDTEAADTTTSETPENPRAAYIDKYWSDFTKEANTTLQAFELLEQTETTLNDYYAHSYVYTQKTGGVTYKHRAVVTYYGDMIVCFTYTATEENYDKHAADVDNMLAEFKFKK